MMLAWARSASGAWPAAIAGRAVHDLRVRTAVLTHSEYTGRARARPSADSAPLAQGWGRGRARHVGNGVSGAPP
eukprot:1088434-Prymnesium_polylepis.1